MLVRLRSQRQVWLGEPHTRGSTSRLNDLLACPLTIFFTVARGYGFADGAMVGFGHLLVENQSNALFKILRRLQSKCTGIRERDCAHTTRETRYRRREVVRKLDQSQQRVCLHSVPRTFHRSPEEYLPTLSAFLVSSCPFIVHDKLVNNFSSHPKSSSQDATDHPEASS
jgi:hypothetical protein